jgi:hypothetical protein
MSKQKTATLLNKYAAGINSKRIRPISLRTPDNSRYNTHISGVVAPSEIIYWNKRNKLPYFKRPNLVNGVTVGIVTVIFASIVVTSLQ